MVTPDAFQTIDTDATILPVGSAPQPAASPSSASAQPSGSTSPKALAANPPAASRRAPAVIPYTAEPTLTPGHGKSKARSNLKTAHAGRYDRVAELGRGGWGVVDRVVDRQLEREVAIKRIGGDGRSHSGELAPEIRERFLHEAKITSQLQHPGVVPVHELVIGESGELFYVMKLLEGDTFGQLIRAQHAPAKSPGHRWTRHTLEAAIAPLLDRFIDICQAVAYAHQQGVIHRDLKPANVMVGGFGETIVVDWGLAKRIDASASASSTPVRVSQHSDQDANPALPAPAPRPEADDSPSGHTEYGSIVGTPAYMSPEQAKGELLNLGPWSDIYSLGVILYETVAGRHPYQGLGIHEVLAQVKAGQRPPLRSVQPAASASLAAICDAAMAYDPTARYCSASALAEDVRRYIAGDAVSVCDEPILDRIWRFCRRHQTSCLTAAASALILLVVSLVFSGVIHQAHQEERASRIQTQSAHESSLRSLSDARDAADTWLFDLSESLEFYPGLSCIRDELLTDAIGQYERILYDLRLESEGLKSIRWKQSDDVPSESLLIANLEEAKCCTRLGDLYRLTGLAPESSRRYDQAEDILENLQRAEGFQDLDGQLQDETTLQEIYVALGRLTRPSHRGTESLIDDDTQQEIAEHLAWLASRLPSDPSKAPAVTEAGGGIELQAACAFVRYQLALHRAGYRTGSDRDDRNRLLQSVLWADWLVNVAGQTRNINLYETALKALALDYQRTGDFELAGTTWQRLVKNLESWSQLAAPRPDRLQSLANAQLKLAECLTKVERPEQSAKIYRAAIEDLNHAWQLLDTDAIHQTSLATAQHKLGELIATELDQKAEAATLLAQAISHYEDLLRREASPVTAQQLAAARASLAAISSHSSASPATPSDQSLNASPYDHVGDSVGAAQ